LCCARSLSLWTHLSSLRAVMIIAFASSPASPSPLFPLIPLLAGHLHGPYNGCALPSLSPIPSCVIACAEHNSPPPPAIEPCVSPSLPCAIGVTRAPGRGPGSSVDTVDTHRAPSASTDRLHHRRLLAVVGHYRKVRCAPWAALSCHQFTVINPPPSSLTLPHGLAEPN
jgi:hypothetical protein